MGSLERWACQELDALGLPDAEDIVRYLQPVESPAEVEEYLLAMLDPLNNEHLNFIEEFLKRQVETKSGLDSRFYRKPDVEESLMTSSSRKKQKQPKDTSSVGQVSNKSSDTVPNVPQSTGNKKKSKYVSVYSEDGRNSDVIILPGRHKCNCQASKHRLINNCTKCGHIVCEQEGSGPCVFCSNLVVTKSEREILNRGSNKSKDLQKKLFSEKNSIVKDDQEKTMSDSLRKAIEHKNRLLDFDKTTAKRTKVYDDESDYFNSNSRWLNPSDRIKLQKHEEELSSKRHDRTANNKVTIDLFGRKVIAEENNLIYDPEDPLIKEILESNSSQASYSNEHGNPYDSLNCPKPVYVSDKTSTSSNLNNILMNRLRIQDKEMQEMSDDGLALSMHQPWASLLIQGIKKHEGRMWYSSHRGRLWIASGSKVPTPEEIKSVEHMYQVLSGDQIVDFPQHYPTGCLLGCVDVKDVLPQEEYQIQYPERESESPFVFICENPQEMMIKFPIKGQHKIYKLDSKIHSAAKKAVKSVN